jgi:GAF domain-containing protein
MPNPQPPTQKYPPLIPQIKSLIDGDPIADMANICALLKSNFDFFWVGFYIVRGKELVLGPFQGSVACVRIAYGRGVCGTAWKDKKTILVNDVSKFAGHIACNPNSKSEIVVPVFNKTSVAAVLDIDHNTLNKFTKTDSKYLPQICTLLSPSLQT